MVLQLRTRRAQLVCFTITMLGVVGAFNGLNALGGGGLADHLMCTKMQTLYTLTLGLTGWLGGIIFNTFGAKWSVTSASVLYCAYLITIIGVNFREWNQNLTYVAGFTVGFGASIMWTAFGTFAIAYPDDPLKGFISIWAALNVGTASLALGGILMGSGGSEAALDLRQYICLLVFMVAVTCFGNFTLTHQKNVTNLRRNSPDEAETGQSTSMISDLPVLLLLTPLAMSPNAHYPFLFNGLNAQYFNIRSRSFNTAIHSLSRIPGTIVLLKLFTLTQTTMTGLYLLAMMTGAALIIAHVTIFNTFGIVSEPRDAKIDAFTDTFQSLLLVICFFNFAVIDSLAQALIYNVLGRLTRGAPQKAAIYTGCYKGVQALGLSAYWGLEWWLTVARGGTINEYTRYRVHWLSLTVQWTAAIPAALLGLLILHTHNVCGHCGSESVNSQICVECSCHLTGKCEGRCQACKD